MKYKQTFILNLILIFRKNLFIYVNIQRYDKPDIIKLNFSNINR